MSLSNFSCVVCGQNFHYLNDSSSWLRRFRILYSSLTGISVSGVGLFDRSYASVCAVPLEYAARWDDPGCRLIEIAVMDNRPIKKHHGFIFHEACWVLLEKTHHPQAVPYSRLYEVCKSMPFIPTLRGSGLSFGHDYGGLGLEENYFPFEDRVFGRTLHSSQFQLSDRNPLYLPEVEQLLKKRPHSIPTIWKHHRTRQARQNANIFSKSPLEEDALSEIPSNADTFSRLPMEIRDMIARLLSTSDFWNLRLASKAFFPIFSNQRFWATRFSQHSDRGWLFELWNSPEHKDWRWLYRCTNDTNLMFALQNRKRIWKLAEHLRDLASLQWKGPSRPYISHKETPGLSYRETAGHLIKATSPRFYHDFHEGCRLLRRQYISIPQSLSQIAFSTVRVGDTEYISGMRLVSSEGAVRKFGYWSERKVYFANITSLRGVHVAVGSRGIQAIQVVTDGHTSQWLGSPTKCPKTRYLAVSKPIKTIKAGYDGCKMVSLGVEFEDVSAIDQPIKEMKSLRDIGLWDPEAPGPKLFLNEYPSLVNGYSPTEYRPVAWASFGGPGGVYLRSLTGIVVTLGGLDSPDSLRFTYDTKAIPKQSGKLGGCNRPYYGRRVHFSIDGSGGEIIEAVEIILKSATASNSGEPRSLMGFKISTNRGRHCSFPPPPSYELSQVEVKAISIAPGTTITGFYVSMHPQWGIKSLGVISEVIENKTGEKSVS